MAGTRQDISNKFRMLTRTLDTTIMSDDAVNEYITAALYELAQILRLNELDVRFTWYTEPFKGTYKTDKTIPQTDPLYDFKNKYTTMDKPVYVGGYESYFTQSREEFYRLYPQLQTEGTVGTGDGVTTNFSGTIANKYIQKNTVVVTSINTNGFKILYLDSPSVNNNYEGQFYNIDTPENLVGSINYQTGVWSIPFAVAPGNTQPVTMMYASYSASKPNVILYHNNEFVVRPIPDKSYPITMSVYKRPDALANAGSTPDIEQWAEFIAYSAARKRLQDTADAETLEMILPEYNRQKRIVQRSTYILLGQERVPSIVTMRGIVTRPVPFNVFRGTP